MSSRHKSVPVQVKAERHFPIRVRIPCPREGMGQRLNQMHHWLHERVGLRRFFQGGERLLAQNDNLFFYFDDLTIAEEFVSHFDCAIIVQDEPPP